MPENSCDVNYYQNVFALTKEADGIARDLRVAVWLKEQRNCYSNKQTADFNPGVDSGFIKLTFGFGR